ncbi:hypothetical protein CR205_02340 [Alteribacter lacisalsi]|uniref:PBP domain-containing protein n=1 Tax=Alteribacter lacisalsi TaxID=2045244 RepID=A0A2W0H8G5_9BACI|nr:substrate-binding domain-containing protein [Alteribacter lacisalsi]PYZ97457.1 hypothetical protein CR205_02340 [Alteribacter lacisalsi]
MDQLGTKIGYSFLITLLALFAGVIGTVFATLVSQHYLFYSYYIPAFVIGFWVILNLGVFRLLKGNVFRVSLLIFSSLAAAVLIGFQIYQGWYDSLEIADGQEVDLYQYKPFQEHTKAVSLDMEASFSLQAGDELPVLDGATALYPVYSAFAQAVYPEQDYDLFDSEVMANQTHRAYASLINGDVDMIFAAGPSDFQLERADEQGVELEFTPIGREAFVFFVNARNPVTNLTIEEIQGIYSGEITDWSEVGGGNEVIRAFQRPPDSGSQTALENLMEGHTLMDAPTDDVVTGMGGIISETANYRNHRNAIGYSFRFFSTVMIENHNIRHLQIEGVPPTPETIRDGTYPIADSFYAVTAGSDNPNIDPFLEWILSEEGQEFIERTGYVPVE